MPISESQQTHRFTQEWLSLQNHYEYYEHGSLAIKLVCVVLFTAGLVFRLNPLIGAALVLVFWLQEGIFKTYQSRLGERLLQVEAGIREEQALGQACQLHTEWLRTRPAGLGLLMAYARNAARPTVAFPYAALLMIDLAACWMRY